MKLQSNKFLMTILLGVRQMEFRNGDKVIFIGDSITESERQKDPEDVGNGYVRIIRDYLWLVQPEMNLTILNRGIGGDRASHLLARWEADVLSQKPDWVSISVGINDEAFNTPVEEFRTAYRSMLEQIKQHTTASIILLETTINLEVESTPARSLQEYNNVIHELAEQFQTILVPMNRTFNEYLQKDTAKLLTVDHVHMNSTGNLLMAKTWLRVILNQLFGDDA
jgi:acyl-CoA thioesterase-1